MTWRLIIRDRLSMGMIPLLAVLFGLAAASTNFVPLPPSQPTRESLRASLAMALALGPSFFVWIILIVQGQRTPYEAALPIAGRDLWLSRLLTLLAMVWLPLLSAIAGGLPPLTLLAAASLYTVVILGVKKSDLRDLAAARRLNNVVYRIVFLIPLAVIILAKPLKSAQWIVLPSAASVLAICGLASAILFWWNWTSVPKSFQFAPPEPVPARSRPQETGKSFLSRSFIWAPVWQSIFGRSMLILLFFLWGNIVSQRLWAAGLAVGWVQVQIRGQCRWLLALPASSRKLFGWIALPQIAAILIGFLAAVLIDTGHPLSARGRLVELAAEVAVLFALAFLSALPAWRRLSRLRAVPLGVWILWTPFAIGTIAPAIFLPTTGAIERLADALPASWLPLASTLAIPVIAAYWLAETAFREQEYRPLFIETRNIGDMRRNSL